METPLSESKAAGALMAFALGGSFYAVGRARTADLAALAQRIQDRRVEAAQRHRDKLSREQVTEILSKILCQEISQKERLEAMLTPEGGAFLFWRCIHRADSKVTEEQSNAWCEEDPEGTVTRLLLASELITIGKPGQAANADPTAASTQPTGSQNGGDSATSKV